MIYVFWSLFSAWCWIFNLSLIGLEGMFGIFYVGEENEKRILLGVSCFFIVEGVRGMSFLDINMVVIEGSWLVLF